MDPYKVLGVNPNDDEETIKKAYRELAKKYHPDKYRNTPQYEWAMEKMKEINAAYDMITGKNVGPGFGNASSGQTGYTGSSAGLFQAVRNLIAQRRTAEAEAMLQRITERPAEWYYLMGMVYSQKGWHGQARDCFATAVRMEPDNFEYNRAYAAYTQQASGFQRRAVSFNSSDPMCRMCQCLLLSQCLSFGGLRWFFCC